MATRSTSGVKYVFTNKDIAFIKANFQTMTSTQLAKGLNLTRTIVRTQCYAMRLKKMEMEYWTDDQVKFLHDSYKKYGDTELAQMFNELWHKNKGWTKKHIEKKRRYLKLKRTQKEKDAIRENHRLQGVYQLGNIRMWNTRGVARIGERRIWKYETGRPFMVIRLKEGFVHYAPWLFEQIYGPVPPGYVVRLKDNNPENVVPGNLEAITRAEHARRNKESNTWYDLPLELKQIIVLNNKLNKTIKKKQV